MARPPKVGLSYFPFDTDFFDDIKVKRFMRAQGAQGFAILIDLLCMIYRDKGYYLEWDDDIAFLVVEDIRCSNDGGVLEAVTSAVKAGLFDADMWERHKVLTSRGIQRRFAEITSRRKNRNRDGRFALISELQCAETALNGVNVNNNPSEREFPQQKFNSNGIIGNDNPQRESKEKEKVNNKTVVVDTHVRTENSKEDFAEVAKLFSDNIHPVSSEIEAEKLGDLFDRFGKVWCLEAINEAALGHGKTVKYIESILDYWDKHGFKAQKAKKGGAKNVGSGGSTRKDKGEVRSEWKEAELRQQQNRPWNLRTDERRAEA